MDTPTPKKRSWFLRHKIITAFVIVLAGTSVWEAGNQKFTNERAALAPHSSASPGANSGTSSGSQSVSGSKSGTSGSSASPTPTSASDSASNYKMTIANSQAIAQPDGSTVVTGEITNNQIGNHSATITATFYDASGAVLGTAKGSVSTLAPGQTKTFTLTTTAKVTDFDKMVVKVSSIS